MHLSEKSKGILALILLAWLFATMALFVRTLDAVADVFTQSYLRIALAAILGLLIFTGSLRLRTYLTLPRKDLIVLTLRALCLYAGVALFTEAVLHTSLSNASIVAAVPLLPLFGYIFLKERVSASVLVAITVGFAGAALIVVDDWTSLSVGYGEVMAFLSMLAFNMSYTARKLHSDHLNNQESSLFMFITGALFLFLMAQVYHEPLPNLSAFTPFILLTLILAALFNVANLYLTNYGFSQVKVAVAGNILTLEIVFALLYSVILFHEIPILQELAGGLLIIGSVLAVNWLESVRVRSNQ